jgi:hypothetical protein
MYPDSCSHSSKKDQKFRNGYEQNWNCSKDSRFLAFDFSSSVFPRISTDIWSRASPISGIKEHSMSLMGSSMRETASKPRVGTEVIREFSFFSSFKEIIYFLHGNYSFYKIGAILDLICTS